MSLIDIEFINPECVVVKNEKITDDSLEDGIDFPINTNDGDDGSGGGGVKCGEIFTMNNVDFTLFCSFCHDTYSTLRDFGQHLRQKHGNGEENILGNQEQQYGRYDSEPGYESSDMEDAGMDHDDGDDYSEPEQKPKFVKILKEPAKFTCEYCNKGYRYKLSFQRHKCPRAPPNHRQLKIVNRPACKIESPVRCKNESPWEQQTDDLGSSEHEVDMQLNPKQIESGCDLCGDVDANELHRCESAKKDPVDPDTDDPVDDEVPNPDLFCDICQRQFKYKNVFRRHAMQHEIGPLALRRDPNYRKCVDCNIEFSNNAEWLEHETNHPKNKPFECTFCPKKYRTSIELEAHTKNHTIEGPVKCDQCGTDFVRYKNLISHINRVHLQLKPFACTLCDKKFPQKAELKVHMRRHTGEKPYQCEECGQSFMVAAKLNEHLKRHAGIRDVQCPVCPMAFVTKKMLRKHMVKHSTERPHVCSTCGNTFSRRKALLAHVKIHMDVKEYVCTLCGKAFAQHAGLYMHKKTHLND